VVTLTAFAAVWAISCLPGNNNKTTAMEKQKYFNLVGL